ncbi:hypothetical protein K491DRAFT_720889 [Lophiostoma macrostomum CBS 122681]|uniref:Uncharacterized protein n=1 Tax=Lophiostoma macrostomum CBS 122681 TaxID=1314788 RepID=A0A6A6STG3_9PLEO|nr:hypothetical protein K491DRAFT_720889 [Lophiostoma macrostomum CBS 122681]
MRSPRTNQLYKKFANHIRNYLAAKAELHPEPDNFGNFWKGVKKHIGRKAWEKLGPVSPGSSLLLVLFWTEIVESAKRDAERLCLKLRLFPELLSFEKYVETIEGYMNQLVEAEAADLPRHSRESEFAEQIERYMAFPSGKPDESLPTQVQAGKRIKALERHVEALDTHSRVRQTALIGGAPTQERRACVSSGGVGLIFPEFAGIREALSVSAVQDAVQFPGLRREGENEEGRGEGIWLLSSAWRFAVVRGREGGSEQSWREKVDGGGGDEQTARRNAGRSSGALWSRYED